MNEVGDAIEKIYRQRALLSRRNDLLSGKDLTIPDSCCPEVGTSEIDCYDCFLHVVCLLRQR